jgi:hypothetical protein
MAFIKFQNEVAVTGYVVVHRDGTVGLRHQPPSKENPQWGEKWHLELDGERTVSCTKALAEYLGDVKAPDQVVILKKEGEGGPSGVRWQVWINNEFITDAQRTQNLPGPTASPMPTSSAMPSQPPAGTTVPATSSLMPQAPPAAPTATLDSLSALMVACASKMEMHLKATNYYTPAQVQAFSVSLFIECNRRGVVIEAAPAAAPPTAPMPTEDVLSGQPDPDADADDDLPF